MPAQIDHAISKKCFRELINPKYAEVNFEAMNSDSLPSIEIVKKTYTSFNVRCAPMETERLLKESVQSVDDFKVQTSAGERPVLEVLKERYKQNAKNPDKAEYFVKIDLLETKPIDKAVNEVGLFGNQNTVCQPKWRTTVERLKTHFPRWDAK